MRNRRPQEEQNLEEFAVSQETVDALSRAETKPLSRRGFSP